MKKIYLVLLSFFSYTVSFSQVRITGVIADSLTMQVVSKATIQLITNENADTSFTITDNSGKFFFENAKALQSKLVISCIGYRDLVKTIHLENKTGAFLLDTLFLHLQIQDLPTIEIETDDPVKIKEDTVQYDATKFKTTETDMAEDLLKKLPGVDVDKDGNVKAQGKDVTKIKVNGKEFFGGDVQNATQNIPAQDIDKVEIIDDYGDQARFTGIKTGEPEKVMNFQLKKDRNKGLFGRATAGYGTEDRYNTRLTANYFKNNTQLSIIGNSGNTGRGSNFLRNFTGGAGNMMRMGNQMASQFGGQGAMSTIASNGDFGFFNMPSGNDGITTAHSIGTNISQDFNKKLTIYGSYLYNNNDNKTEQTTAKQTFYSDSTLFANQLSNSGSKSQSHRSYMNVEWNIDSANYLKLTPNFTYTQSNGNSMSVNNTTYNNGSLLSNTNQTASSESHSPVFSSKLLYNHRLKKPGRVISSNFSFNNNNVNSDRDNFTDLYYPLITSPALQTDTVHQTTNQDDNSYGYSANVSYVEPLSKTKFLELNYGYNYSFSKTDKEVRNIDDYFQTDSIDYNLSNAFQNTFEYHTMGANYQMKEDKIKYTLGFTVQPVKMNSLSISRDENFVVPMKWNLVPSAEFNYQPSLTQRFSVRYNGKPKQPSVSQLQPVSDVSNPTYIYTGNPDLDAEFTHTINVGYNNFNFQSGQVMFFNLSVITTEDKIVNNTNQSQFGSQTVIPENVNGYYNTNAFYNFSKPFKNRMYIISINGFANYNNNISLVNNEKNIGKNWILNQRLNAEWNFKEWLEFNLGGGINYNTVKYSLTGTNSNTTNYELLSNFTITFLKTFILKSDFDYLTYTGVDASVNKDQYILNASIEKQFFKDKALTLRVQAFDIFNNNTNITRTVSDNYIQDVRSNKVGQYYLFGATYKFNQKAAKNSPQQQNQMLKFFNRQ